MGDTTMQMEVFTESAKQPANLETLQARLGLHPRSARDFFDTLVAMAYLGGMLEMCNHRLFRFWADLTEDLRTGQPQNEVKHGRPNLFETLYAEPAP